MGADIHVVVEYDREVIVDRTPLAAANLHYSLDYDDYPQTDWKATGTDERAVMMQYPDGSPVFHVDTMTAYHYLDRSYLLFSLIADVRNYWQEQSVAPIVPPRGLPRAYSYEVEHNFFLHVGDDDDPKYEKWEGWCTRSKAEEWTGRSYSYWRLDRNGERMNQISHPDWHSTTWLTADELERVHERYLHFAPIIFPDEAVRATHLPALVAAMRVLDSTICPSGGCSRFVCWFDN